MSDIIDQLSGLGFCTSREQIEALLSHAITSRLSPVQLLEQLAEIERRQREARNLVSRTRRATIGKHTTIDRFDWGLPRKIDRTLCEQILGLAFVSRCENVLFRGPAGVGKTMLAQNTCTAALAAGMTVCFTNVASALADLLKQESLPAVERRLTRYTNVDLLVCDELGYVPVDTRAVDLFFQIISRRHEKASTIITTNLPFKEWGAVFPAAGCLVPLIDRFTQHLHIVDIEGDSYRQTHGGINGTSPTDAPPRQTSSRFARATRRPSKRAGS
jgi:DNA replication protein DnaC